MKTNVRKMKMGSLLMALLMALTMGLGACGTSKETEIGTETDTETTSETETEIGTETEPESSTESDVENATFFGKVMDKTIVEINEKTLSNEKSGLFDILNAPETMKGEDVKAMIEAYTFPENAYLGGQPVTEQMISDLNAYRNLDAIPEEVMVEYAICTTNGSIRAFPTSLLLTDTEDMSGFDYLQETGINFATGVLVYHYTADMKYAFAQAENYRGWISCEELAFTAQEAMVSFLSQEHFLVSVKPGTSEDGHDRMGVILPYTDKNETEAGTEYMVLLPKRNEDGCLTVEDETVLVGEDGAYHDGFLTYSVDSLLALAETFLGTKYGWGDMNDGYDCSSTVGAIYKCFGVYCPRNTSQLPAMGVTVINTEEMTGDEKFELIKQHPGCIVRMNGHAGIGIETGEVIHNNTVFRNEAGGAPVENWSCVKSDFRYNFDANGLTFMERVKSIIFVE